MGRVDPHDVVVTELEAPSILGEVDHLRLGTWRTCVIAILSSHADTNSLEVCRDACDAIVSQYPQGFWGIAVLEGVPRRMMGAPARAVTREIFAALGPHILGCAVVIEGDDRYVAAIRALMNLIMRALPHPFDVRVEATVSEAAEWLSTRGAPLPSTELVGVTGMLRPGASVADPAFW